MMHAGSGHSNLSQSLDAARHAITRAMAQMGGRGADVVFLYATYHHLNVIDQILELAMEICGTRAMIGCSGMGVLTDDRENDREPGIAVLVLSGDALRVIPVSGRGQNAGVGIGDRLLPYGGRDGLLVLMPGVGSDAARLISDIEGVAGDLSVVGGVASGNPWEQHAPRTIQWCGEDWGEDVVAGVLLTDLQWEIGVAQGCQPFGQAYTVTQADGQVIQQIAFAPAVDALKEALDSLTAEEKAHLRNNVFVGLAMDEYATDRGRGDFLIRSLVGIHERSGALGINEQVAMGQTIQFNRRTPDAAHEDMVQVMRRLRLRAGRREGMCALNFNCMGRGFGLYGQPDHDVLVIRKELGVFPMAGFFGNAELAPVGGRNLVHSYTGVVTLLWEDE